MQREGKSAGNPLVSSQRMAHPATRLSSMKSPKRKSNLACHPTVAGEI
jgi:hypothetical protein